MQNADALTNTLIAYASLAEHPHIDDAVDSLVERIGWDAAFLTLAAMEERKAAQGLYSMICGLFIADHNSSADHNSVADHSNASGHDGLHLS